MPNALHKSLYLWVVRYSYLCKALDNPHTTLDENFVNGNRDAANDERLVMQIGTHKEIPKTNLVRKDFLIFIHLQSQSV
jgi:hypothetical protein